WQPVVQRHQSHLRAVAHQKEHESDRHDGRLQLGLDGVEVRPKQRSGSRTEHLLGGEVDEDGSEQRLGDADAAEDEVLPRRVERVHEQLLAERNQRAAFDDARHEHGGGGEAEAAERGVYFRSARPVSDEGKNRASSERRQQKGEELDRHQCSLSFSRCRVSSVSKRSRISKMKTPRISAATSTSSATPSSTTIGMP